MLLLLCLGIQPVVARNEHYIKVNGNIEGGNGAAQVVINTSETDPDDEKWTTISNPKTYEDDSI